jgi:hypothetical protein
MTAGAFVLLAVCKAGSPRASIYYYASSPSAYEREASPLIDESRPHQAAGHVWSTSLRRGAA